MQRLAALVLVALALTGGASLSYLAVGWDLSGGVGAIGPMAETDPVASANLTPDQLPADTALVVREFRVERAANLSARYMPEPPRASREACGVDGALVRSTSRVQGAGSAWSTAAGSYYGTYNQPLWDAATFSAGNGSRADLFMGTLRGNASEYEVFANLSAEDPVLAPQGVSTYRFWCGARYSDFDGTYHGSETGTGVGRNLTWSVATEEGSQVLMQVYAPQPTLRCRLEIWHNGSLRGVDATYYRRNGSSIEPTGQYQSCLVRWAGPPGDLTLRIDEVAGRGTQFLYAVVDADPARLPVIPNVSPRLV